MKKYINVEIAKPVINIPCRYVMTLCEVAPSKSMPSSAAFNMAVGSHLLWLPFPAVLRAMSAWRTACFFTYVCANLLCGTNRNTNQCQSGCKYLEAITASVIKRTRENKYIYACLKQVRDKGTTGGLHD